MNWRRTRWLLAILVVLAPLGLALFVVPRSAAGQAPARVLLVTATAGYYHSSIPTVREVVQRLGADSGEFAITLLSDPVGLSLLNPVTLAGYDVIFFANTTGELPLDVDQKQALLDFVARGGGFVGAHSAADTLHSWPEYGQLVGAQFREHPWIQLVTVTVEDQAHPITRSLGPSFEIYDEIYVFRASPRPSSHVLLTLDPASVGASGDPSAGSGRDSGQDFPLSWCRVQGSGRVYYTALGHFESTWLDPRFQQHLLNALRWAAGRLPGGCEVGA